MIKILYFSGDHCSVCKALKPKLIAAISNKYPAIEFEVLNVTKSQKIAAQHLVFTLPVLLIMVEGKEQYRFARSFSITEVMDKLERLTILIDKN